MLKRNHLILCAAGVFSGLLSVACSSTQTEEQKAEDLVAQMTLDEKIQMLSGKVDGFHTASVPRLGIPSLRMADGPQGVRNKTQSTYYPCGVSLAATWNRNHAYDMGMGLAKDAKARGVHIMLGPGVNIYRSATNGRNFEYFGEDPVLASAMACNYIEGMQDNGVMATIKHFAGNNQEYERHKTNSIIDERTLNEIYFPVFKDAVQKAHVGAIMTSYNPLNGVHAAESEWLTKDVLRKEWGFDGFIMSDWRSTYSTLGCINSGLDLEMPRSACLSPDAIKPLLEKGIILESEIDEKCVNILKTFIRFGFLEEKEASDLPLNNPECNAIARNVALEGPVLLKNEGVLPLAKEDHIVVLGPNIDEISFGGGSGKVTPLPENISTVYSALSAKLGDKVIKLEPDEAGNYDDGMIRSATAVIMGMGLNGQIEGEGHDRPYDLPEIQNEQIRKVAALNDRVIVLINSGGEVAMPWLDQVEAVIMAWYPGQEGGNALCSILTGEASPSGRLPFTIWGTHEKNPAYEHYHLKICPNLSGGRDIFYHTPYNEGIFIGYRGMSEDNAPLFPFGYGLTYTSFSYTDFAVHEKGDGFDICFTLANTGDVKASEVAQVYITEIAPSVSRPQRELKGFEKVSLQPGESKEVTIHLDRDSFQQYDLATHQFMVRPGKYEIHLSRNAVTDCFTGTVEL